MRTVRMIRERGETEFMSALTIITPAYNRAELLPRLYESLLRQTNSDFDWLVVDDGSTDGTSELIQGYREEKKIPISYERQQNAGKHTALNRGIAGIGSELTFIVDSDDYLPEDAVWTILKYHGKYRSQKEKLQLCGYSFLRFYSNGEVNTAYFRKDEEVATYLQVRINGNIGGDKAEVFYTEVLKEFPFPEIEGEKFLAEDVVWMRMSERYRMVHINKCIYICDYLENGLTRTGRRMKIHSPKGMVLRSQVYLENKEVCLKVKMKMLLLYVVYGKFAGETFGELRKGIKGNLFLFWAAYLPGLLLYGKWKRG